MNKTAVYSNLLQILSVSIELKIHTLVPSNYVAPCVVMNDSEEPGGFCLEDVGSMFLQMFVPTYQITLCHNPEDCIMNVHTCENFKSY
jgi:hypothetical protein